MCNLLVRLLVYDSSQHQVVDGIVSKVCRTVILKEKCWDQQKQLRTIDVVTVVAADVAIYNDIKLKACSVDITESLEVASGMGCSQRGSNTHA